MLIFKTLPKLIKVDPILLKTYIKQTKNMKILTAAIICTILPIAFLGFFKTWWQKILAPQQSSQIQISQFTKGPGDYDFSLIHDGLSRKYKVHVPPSYDKISKTPAIIAIHGGAGNADGSINFFQLNPKSDKEGFIVVYPEGTGPVVLGELRGSWNGGRCCNPALENNVDDVGFIRAMIDKLEKDFAVDKKRIYATGMSNGAIMSYALACNLSDKIAAIAPIGSVGLYNECNLTRPVPVMHFHGTADPCAKYEGCDLCMGCVAIFLQKLGFDIEPQYMAVISVPKFIDEWRQKNGCSSKTKITYQNGNASCNTYQGCQKNAETTLCTIVGMGHTWPGSADYGIDTCKINPDGYICNLYKETVGPLSQDINANDAMWEFFKKHPIN